VTSVRKKKNARPCIIRGEKTKIQILGEDKRKPTVWKEKKSRAEKKGGIFRKGSAVIASTQRKNGLKRKIGKAKISES